MTSPENREKEWWDRWWATDWSWEALAKKEWKDGKTLQDYWRDEEDRLVKGPNGKHYTRAHTPLRWPTGIENFDLGRTKNRWLEDDLQALADDLAARLENHRGTDNPARFDGTVLPIVPAMLEASKDPDAPAAQQPASLIADHAWLQTDTAWSSNLFENVIFGGTSFSGSYFAGGASFSDASFSGFADFREASFSDFISFQNASFNGIANFAGASFNDGASFSHASFSDEASFSDTSFSGFAQFASTNFSSNARFGFSSWNGPADFSRVRFGGSASFLKANFSDDTLFTDATFAPVFPRRTANVAEQISALEKTAVSFASATFQTIVSFRGAKFASLVKYSRRAFHGVTFQGNLYTERTGNTHAPSPIGAFDGAQIERFIFLDPSQTTADGSLPIFLQEQLASIDRMDPEQREENLRSIAEGARVLQIAMEKGRNREAEQYFHRVEMIVRRKLNKSAWHVWPPARWKGSIRARVSDGYELFSSYGSSIHRPLITLAAAWLVMAMVYWPFSWKMGGYCPRPAAIQCTWKTAQQGFVPAFTFSASTALRPGYAISVRERTASRFERRIFYRPGFIRGAQSLALRLVATLHNFFSLVMLFLTVLAARRYYQLG